MSKPRKRPPPDMGSGRVQFGSSLSREMHAFLAERAKKNGRALSQEIEAILKRALRMEVLNAAISGEI